MEEAQLVKMITKIVHEQLQNKALLQRDQKHLDKPEDRKITIGVSNRHVHLSDKDLDILFGPGANLTTQKDLSQPGQFASEQLVTLVGPKGVIEKVRVLGPTRNRTQVEISVTDCFKLGIQAPIRDSGDLEGSARVTLLGPVGSVTLKEGPLPYVFVMALNLCNMP